MLNHSRFNTVLAFVLPSWVFFRDHQNIEVEVSWSLFNLLVPGFSNLRQTSKKHYYSGYIRYFGILIFGINRRRILLFEKNKIKRTDPTNFSNIQARKVSKKMIFYFTIF